MGSPFLKECMKYHVFKIYLSYGIPGEVGFERCQLDQFSEAISITIIFENTVFRALADSLF